MRLRHRKLLFPEFFEGSSFLSKNMKYEVQSFDRLRKRR